MKTIEEHLSDLPEPYRTQALKNMWWERKGDQFETQQKSLALAFIWHKSPEGYKYWHNLHAPMVGNCTLY